MIIQKTIDRVNLSPNKQESQIVNKLLLFLLILLTIHGLLSLQKKNHQQKHVLLEIMNHVKNTHIII